MAPPISIPSCLGSQNAGQLSGAAPVIQKARLGLPGNDGPKISILDQDGNHNGISVDLQFLLPKLFPLGDFGESSFEAGPIWGQTIKVIETTEILGVCLKIVCPKMSCSLKSCSPFLQEAINWLQIRFWTNTNLMFSMT